MFKCRDEAGKITYSSDECAKIGLSPAGAVKERVIVTPTRKPKPLPPMARDLAYPKEPASEKEAKQKCFLVQTPFGTSRRCIDAPEGSTVPD